MGSTPYSDRYEEVTFRIQSITAPLYWTFFKNLNGFFVEPIVFLQFQKVNATGLRDSWGGKFSSRNIVRVENRVVAQGTTIGLGFGVGYNFNLFELPLFIRAQARGNVGSLFSEDYGTFFNEQLGISLGYNFNEMRR